MGKKKGRIFGVVNGMPDQGKSYFVKKYLIPKMVAKRPVLVLDIVGEYEGQQYNGFDDFYNYVRQTGGVERKVHCIKWTKQETAINLINFVRQMEKPLCLVLEEAHILFNNTELQKGIKHSLPEICFLGAHHGFSVILCSQRPKSLPTDVRSASQFIVSFRQTEQADLDYLRKKAGAPANTSEVVASLDKKQFFSIGQQPKGFGEIKINQVNQL